MLNSTELPQMIDSTTSNRYPRHGSRKQAGFTLVELMIVIVIAGVMAGIGLPMFQRMYLEQQVKTTVSDAQIALLLARSEAIKRNATVSIFGKAGGWEVRLADSTVIQDRNDLPATMTVVCNTDADTAAEVCPTVNNAANPNVAFNRTGRVDDFIELRFYFTNFNDIKMRCLTTSLSGRAFVEVDSDTDKANGCG